MELFVLRHAIAGERSSRYPDDSDRPLTDEGRTRLKQVAAQFDTLDVRPDTIISSPYVRARQTAELAARSLGLRRDIVFTDTLTPESRPSALLDLLVRDWRGAESIMLVGHEPHLSHFISYVLTGTDRVRLDLKKAGLCKLTLDHLGTEDQVASLNWLLTPGQMRRLQ